MNFKKFLAVILPVVAFAILSGVSPLPALAQTPDIYLTIEDTQAEPGARDHTVTISMNNPADPVRALSIQIDPIPGGHLMLGNLQETGRTPPYAISIITTQPDGSYLLLLLDTSDTTAIPIGDGPILTFDVDVDGATPPGTDILLHCIDVQASSLDPPGQNELVAEISDGTIHVLPGAADFQVIPINYCEPNIMCIHSGSNGTVETAPAGDDEITSTGIHTGANGFCESTPAGDDAYIDLGAPYGAWYLYRGNPGATAVALGSDGVCRTLARGDDEQLIPVGGSGTPGQACVGTGSNGYCETFANNAPSLLLEINGEHPPTDYVVSSGPVHLTLDMDPGLVTESMGWYFAYVYEGTYYWLTATGVSQTPGPLLDMRPMLLEDLTLINTDLPPGTVITFLFILIEGTDLVALDYISAVISGAASSSSATPPSDESADGNKTPGLNFTILPEE